MEEYWRNYLLGNANVVDIFGFIKKAITVAATDYPTEFKNNKDKIFETLYSCELIKCSGCDKCNKRTSNVSSKKTQEDGFPKESIPKAKSIVCRQGVAEVLRIKGILEEEAGESESEWVICDLLAKLGYMGLTFNTLEVTGIGKTVNVLRKHASEDVSQIAGRLVKEWKNIAEEWLKNEAEEEQVIKQKTSLITEEHQLSRIDSDKENKAKDTDQQISKDHMYSKEVLSIQQNTKRKPLMEKENRRVNNQTMEDVVVKKVLPVAKTHQSGINSKTTKGLAIPPHQQQCKPGTAERNRKSEEEEEKLEATKRKLRQGYEDAENMKKKRRIQVMEFHQIPKLPQQLKPRGHQFRRSGNAHRRIGQLVISTY